MIRLMLATLMALLAAPAIAQDDSPVAQAGAGGTVVASARSPGNVLQVELLLTGEGRIDYRVTRRGTEVIAPSRLGFILADGYKLERNFALVSDSTRRHDERWEQPWGERRFVRDRHTELRTVFREKIGGRRNLAITFRVFDDGIGFRYAFPDAQEQPVRIVEELTEFAVAEPGATAWWIPGGEWNRYEYLYNRTALDQVGQAHTPITIRTPSGLHLSFHEAALVDYSAMWLRRVDGQRLKAVLSPAADGPPVVREAPFATPWRTIQITDSAAALYNGTDLMLNLNEPNALGDVSWVVPHKYVGIWWGMHLDTQTWNSGPRHGATTANTRAMIDFAAENGFRGVLVEGWNVGWDGEWFATGWDFSFTQAYPDFDLEGLAAYARQRNVRLIGHHETSANIANYEAQLPAALDLYARLGVDSIKTGYVADAGGVQARAPDGRIRFEWHDGQRQVRHHLTVVQEAARRRIAINAHEPVKDTGLRRTYPNWVAREGARGMEYNAWGQPPNPPEHEPNLIFTRMLSGPMDFTPGVLSLTGKGGIRIESTVAKQLALYVVLYSPIQMAADLAENYARYPGPFQFIRDVPTDWAETIALNGEVGDYATIVRKDRRSNDWYLGSVTDESPRTLEVTLDFLDRGRAYEAQIYRDGPNAAWNGDGHDIVIERRTVRRGERLMLQLGAGGGQAIRFVRR